MRNYKPGDIVLVKSIAGDAIPKIHVRLTRRVIVKETKGKRVGIRMTMDWPGYSGWEAEVVFQDEIDNIRKNWSIPFESPETKLSYMTIAYLKSLEIPSLILRDPKEE